MLIGYAALQPGATGSAAEPHAALVDAGVSRLFIDVLVNDAPRSQREAAIGAVQTGDVLVVANIESLARSPADLFGIVSRLEAKGASLRVLRVANMMSLDTSSIEGRAMLGALAILHAMAPGEAMQPGLPGPEPETGPRPRGRPATAFNQSDEVARLRASGLRATDIADRLGIGRASVYRILSQGPTPSVVPTPEKAGSGRATQLARRLHKADAAS